MSTGKGSTEGSSGGPPSKDPRNKSKATEKVTAASAQGREGSLARQAARRRADKAPTSAAPFEVGRFENGGVTMYYEIHGSGPRVFVFMHGILLDANLNRRLATDLAAAGNRVILLDLPGHGLSDKPRRASYHRMDTYARHVEALLDHLDIDKAVVGGVSLGGKSPSPGGLAVPRTGTRVGGRDAGSGMGRSRRGHHVRTHADRRAPGPPGGACCQPHHGDVSPAVARSVGQRDEYLSNDPVEIAVVLHGVLTGPISPTVEERDNMHIPALVIGHRSDRIHPFHDAEQLADRLPYARLLQAASVLELRLKPERLTGEIAQFLDAVWDTPSSSARAS